MVTTALHDGHFPCLPSKAIGSCIKREHWGQVKLILDMIYYRVWVDGSLTLNILNIWCHHQGKPICIV
jgi:hypothetical protein